MVDFQSLVERKLTPTGLSGSDIIYPCPKCEDLNTGHHLYVNYNKGYWHCFHCNSGGKRIESLLKALNIDVNYDYGKLYDEREKELDNIISPVVKKKSKKVEFSTDLNILTEYFNIHTTTLSMVAYNYLLSRGLSPEMIARLNIREGLNRYGEVIDIGYKKVDGRDYSGRIMVPSMRKDHLISFYVARDYTGYKENKYLNPPKELSVASEDVWSLDIIDTSNIIICEGVFTAIAVNKALGKITACATYGKSIAQTSSESTIEVTSQGEKLLAKKFNQYILFYDKDATESSYNTAKYLHDRGADVRVVTIETDKYGPKADANDMTSDEVIEHIKCSKKFDSFFGII